MELRARPEDVSTLLCHLPFAVITTDLDGVVTSWNEEATRLYGWSEEEALGRNITTLTVPTDTLPDATQILAEVAGGATWRGPFEAMRKGGGLEVVEVVDLPLVNGDGQVGVVGLSYRSDSPWRHLIESGLDPVSIHDREGRFRYASPAFRDVLGYEPEELLGTDPYELFHPEDVGDVASAHERMLTTGEPQVIQYRMRRSDVTYIWVESTAQLGSEGTIIVQIRPIRARRSLLQALEHERLAAERLRQLEQQQAAFLTTIAHRARHPITAVVGFAELLDQLLPDERDPRIDQILHRLAANAEELSELIQSVTDSDRLSRRTQVSAPSPFLLRRLMEEVVRERAGDDGVVTVEVPEPATLVADRAQVRLALQALLHNAVVHTPLGTPVWLRWRAGEDGVTVMVDDAGPGVDPSVRGDIWEPFRHGEVDPHDPGLGLGLAVVREVAGMHGGRAWVEDHEGGGASFRMFFPQRRAEDSA